MNLGNKSERKIKKSLQLHKDIINWWDRKDEIEAELHICKVKLGDQARTVAFLTDQLLKFIEKQSTIRIDE